MNPHDAAKADRLRLEAESCLGVARRSRSAWLVREMEKLAGEFLRRAEALEQAGATETGRSAATAPGAAESPLTIAAEAPHP